MLWDPKKVLLFLLALVYMIMPIGCSNERLAEELEIKNIDNEESLNDDQKVFWDEVNENGVDEDLLMKNIDEETLKYVAKQLQDLCDEIDEKGNRDKDYWLTGQWYSDVTDSKQYQNVVSTGKKAMKPLFLIIYKSESSGLYEWACSKALEEISGYPVVGMSYPFGSFNRKTAEVMANCGIVYSRTTAATGNFRLPEDFLLWHPSCHHRNGLEMAKSFLSTMNVLYRS